MAKHKKMIQMNTKLGLVIVTTHSQNVFQAGLVPGLVSQNYHMNGQIHYVGVVVVNVVAMGSFELAELINAQCVYNTVCAA